MSENLDGGKLAALEALLGPDVFFVPCEPGTKIPRCTYVRRPIEETRDDVYRYLLERSNVAVYLGAASRGLCALDFDHDEDLDAFLSLNRDTLGRSLRVKGARGAQVWFRVKGDYPESVTCAHYEWRATDRLSTICGRHPSGVDYTRLVDAPPVEIEWAKIAWPAGWPVPGDDQAERELEKLWGAPLELNAKGAPSKLNQGFAVARFGMQNDILWDPATGRFHVYQDSTGLWVSRPDEEISGRCVESVRDLINEIADNAPEASRWALRKGHLLNNGNFQRGVLTQLRGYVFARDRFAHRQPGIVHALNGMLDLTVEPFAFKPFGREFYSRNQVPVIYEPGAGCPRFVNELLAPQLDEDDQRLLQMWCGQAILHNNLHQNFLVMTGTAGGGKGTVTRLVKSMVGERNVFELRTMHLGNSRFETGFYHGKSMLYGPDVDPDFLSNDGASQIKSLTGGDPLIGEVKGRMDAHSMTGDFNVLVTCNSRLVVKLQGDVAAWARRMLWLPFERPAVEKPIPNLDKELFASEGPGILNWMVAGAVEVLRCAREHTPFPQTDGQRSRVRALLAESDSVREFIMRRVRRDSFPTAHITSEALYRGYLETCDAHGWTGLPQRAFLLRADDVLVAEFRAHKDKNLGEDRTLKGWRGVRLDAEKFDLEMEGGPF
jgi:phage/plasmid-associated DNA primase